MSRAGDDGLELISDDDLIEVHVSRAARPASSNHRNRGTLENLLPARAVPPPPPRTVMNLQFPSPAAGGRMAAGPHSSGPSSARSSHAPPSRAQTSHHPHSFRRHLSRTPQQDATVIDLTDEPDSPVDRRRTQQQQQPQQQQQQQQNNNNNIGRNPRRTNSQRISPPSLSRSDSTLIGPQASFIDLTDDSPEDEQRSTRRARLATGRNSGQFSPPDQLISFELMHHHHQAFTQELIGRTLAGIFHGGMMGTNYDAQDFDLRITHTREESPKPPMEPVPPTRPGFTRDTCADAEQEKLIICPACNEELAYDPSEASGPASTSKKRKRAPGEHHFWALKKCGHVYCAECFENRRPTKASPEGVGFPVTGGKMAINAPNDIRCVVEGCETKVAAKTEWVGIFL